MHIAIEINATGNSCKGCKLFDELKCPFSPVDDWFDFNKWNEDGERLPECIAAEIPVECGTCADFERGGCSNCITVTDMGETVLPDWVPPTVGNQ